MTQFKPFTVTDEQLKQAAQTALALATKLGAAQAAAECSEGGGLNVSVRKGKVETIEQNRDKGLGVTVYLQGKAGKGMQRGNASTSDLSPAAIEQTVRAAMDIARYTAADDAAGLADPDALERSPRDLKLFYPWDINSAQAIEIAQECEHAAFSVDKRITNSEGAGVSVQHGHFVMANTHGFCSGYSYSRHSLSVSPIAGKGNDMQGDSWYSSERDSKRLANPTAVGQYAAHRSLAKLKARKLSTRQCPVLFEAPLASGLLGALTQALSGGALYRKASFLVDSLGTAVMADHLDVLEDPFVVGATGSAPFDEEGVQTQRRHVVKDGVVQGYFLGTYSARKLGMRTTGNAGGSHNLSLISKHTKAKDDFVAMLRKLGTGLLVTDLMGQGTNYVTGDYSRGAQGFWVENGVIAYPVHEITIASNMKDMLRGIVAVGADTISRGTKITGSVLIDKMTVAGV